MTFLISTARLEAMLREDAPYGDLTTQALDIGETRGQAVLRAGATMTLCCAEEAEALFRLAGCTDVHRVAASGGLLEEGGTILTAEGPAAALHLAAKAAQALMETASSVASRAARIRGEARSARPDIVVACTRRHLPGVKDVMLKAIMTGGCIPHRLGLSDSLLVSAQHRAFLGREPAHRWVSRLRAAQPARRLVVEAYSVDEAVLLAHAGVDTVQCDRLPPEQFAEVARALTDHPDRPVLAAAGDIHEGNAAAYARAGADVLVTSAPYAAPPLEVKVSMDRLG
ncbi:ModD protein [Pseudoroseomonas ludipueritiae]|uniref:Putative pyrophosphorylase ModD n=1 Tax=Pseudoroseomonas ludipueritiae TaxID=198093 RepID=A0ABR7R3T1_9PROT|nr:ModD protein [Pseudoroseomonas ludipueritiae]MBC9176409.1 ModD protein [Pseudoroseomonas ludipueritiae]MCG7360918.1 ModD protein [Roseomonas sp. ACRSG]